MNIEIVEKAVRDLNNVLANEYLRNGFGQDDCSYLTFTSDGQSEYVEFLGKTIWCSETDDNDLATHFEMFQYLEERVKKELVMLALVRL